MGTLRSHKELQVWQGAMDAAMDIFPMTKTFPAEEKYSLVDQNQVTVSIYYQREDLWQRGSFPQ
jgi:hypothetical protein